MVSLNNPMPVNSRDRLIETQHFYMIIARYLEPHMEQPYEHRWNISLILPYYNTLKSISFYLLWGPQMGTKVP